MKTAKSAAVRALVVLLTAFVFLVAFEHTSDAAVGWVTGGWRVRNMNGSFCPSTETTTNCAGAWYTQASRNTNTAIANALVVVNDENGNQVGQGYTNNSGTYTIRWETLLSDPAPETLTLKVAAIHERFGIYFPGGQWATATGLTLQSDESSTQAAPQDFGVRQVGTSSAPNPYFNAYWAAEIQWRAAMAPVGALINDFWGVEVRGFQNTITSSSFIPLTDTCNSSCAWGPMKQVQLDGNAGFAPQARVMHELGHIASYWVRPWTLANSANLLGLDYSLNGGTWTQGVAEFASAGYEEAFATHYGSVTFWNSTASVTPTTCLANLTAHCYSGGTPAVPQGATDIEASSNGTVNNCVANENRFPISIMRFLWDVYDNRNDTTTDTYTIGGANYWKHVSMMTFYPAGTGAGQHDDTWDPTRTTVSEPDGRGVLSYTSNAFSSAGLPSLANQYANNCFPL